MATVYYETAPAPAVDGTSIDFNENGELGLTSEVNEKLNNFDEDNKLKDEALSTYVTEKLAKVDDIEEDVAEINAQLSDNLENGYISDGNMVIGMEVGTIDANGNDDNGRTDRTRCKGMIKVEPNTTYTISCSNGGNVAVNQFNNNTKVSDSGWQSTPCTFTTPSNVNGIRFVTPSGTIVDCKMEKGSVATPFTGYYGKSNVQLTEELSNLAVKKGKKTGITGATGSIYLDKSISECHIINVKVYNASNSLWYLPLLAMDKNGQYVLKVLDSGTTYVELVKNTNVTVEFWYI